MPWGLCRRKKKPKTLADTFGELLEEIDSEIRASEERLLKFRAGHTSVSRGLIFYGVAAYGLILAAAYLFTPDPRVFWQKAARVGVVMGFPLLLWVMKKLVDLQYGRAIAKEQQRLAKLSKKRADTCADLESKADWKKLAKLLGKPDAPPPQQRPPSANGPVRPGAAGGAVGPDMKTPARPGHNTYVPPVQAYVPTARTRADKFVDYILGDGPNNRYALICAKCFTHNGLARVEEVSRVRYRCTMCQFLNGPPLPGGAAAAAGAGAGAGAAVPPTPLKGASAPGGPGTAAPATPKSGAKDSGSDMDTADPAVGAAAGAGAGAGSAVPGSAVKAPNAQAPPATPVHGGGGGAMGAVPVVNGVPFVQMTPQAYRAMNPTQQQHYNAWFKEFKAHVSGTPKAGAAPGAAAAAAAASAAAATPKPAPAGGPVAATPARPLPAAGTDTPAPAQAPATK